MGRAKKLAEEVTPLLNSVVPRYRQVEAILRDQIWLGELAPGDQLPTEEALCHKYAVSRATIRQALQILEADNLIRKEVARGTFVNATSQQVPRGLIDIGSEQLLHMDMFDEIAVKRTGVFTPRGEVQTALAMAAEAKAFFFLRVFYLNGEPVGGEQVYVAPEMAQTLTEKEMSAAAISDEIARKLERSIVRTDLRLSALTADARHSIRFNTLSGAPLISVLRTSYDEAGEPFEHGHMLFRCDRCQIVLGSPVRAPLSI